MSQFCRDEVIAKLKAGDIQAALCALAIECPDVPADTCVPLATITVGADGSLTIPDPCAARPVVPTNRALLELITCLAHRIEECCGSTPARAFRIEDLAVGNRDFTTYHKLSETPAGISVPAGDEPAVIVITFSDDIDESSVALGTNVVVTDEHGVEPSFNLPPDISSTHIRLELVSEIFSGTYTVTVSGDPPNPVQSTAGKALDAEFKTTFTVTN